MSSAPPDVTPADRRRRVLIVEDHPATCLALERLVRQGGHEVDSAGDALGGIGLLRERRPDRILLDLMLPGLPGEHVLHAVRAFAPAARVAVLTGIEDGGRLGRLAGLGADRVMRKPVDLAALMAWIAAD